MSRCRLLAVALAAIGAVVLAAPAGASSYVFGERSLRYGMRGHDVRVLQDFLTRVGVRTPVDGQYGPVTARRVRTWERRTARRVNGLISRPDAGVLRAQVETGAGVSEQPSATSNPTDTAVLGPDGTAIAPDSAPDTVKAVIAAANQIVGKPYGRGGGHRRWAVKDTVVDCSGAVSWALHGGGLLDEPLPSGPLMSWDEPGDGDWITVYANEGHVFMIVAGLRYDTGWHDGDGPLWTDQRRPTDGFVRRHPAGL